MGLQQQGGGFGFFNGDRRLIQALCQIGRQLALRLDQIIHLQGGPRAPDNGMEIYEEPRRFDETTELVRLSLASYPADHIAVAVGTALTPLAENVSPNPVPVLLVNNDAAQLLRYGGPTMTLLTGGIVHTEDSKIIQVPPNATLYGMVAVATISVSVSHLILPRFSR